MNIIEREYNDKIYNKIYSIISRKYVEIFLCGGASKEGYKSFRDLLKENILEKTFGKIRVLYPEDLFMEILVTKKDSNLLELESFLAKHSDLICIVCESPGSFVELGVFSTSQELKDKILVLIEKKYEKKRSFINMGPVKHLNANSNSQAVHYYENINDAYKILLKKSKDVKKNNSKELNTIINISYFIQILLFFKNKIEIIEISEYIIYKSSSEVKGTIITAALKLLFNDNMLSKDSNKGYYLTKKGYNILKNDLKEVGIKSEQINKLRLEYLRLKYYSPHGKNLHPF